MKIAISNAGVPNPNSYMRHLNRVLATHAPQHEYHLVGKCDRTFDLYHCLRCGVPFTGRLGVPTVLTIPNLNFLRYPHLFTLRERIFVLRAYRRALQRANRLIALNSLTREELAGRLGLDPRKIEVMLPLAAEIPRPQAPEPLLDTVRRKYALPENFILSVGAVEPRHHPAQLLEALTALPKNQSLVICGRRTSYSERLLEYVRRHHLAIRVEFIYELSPDDLPALFAMARAFVYLPSAELDASIVPVVEALRLGVPMLLSDTPLNRETAADAALYADPTMIDRLGEQLRQITDDAAVRKNLHERALRQAEIFSEYAVAERLIRLYSEL